LGLNHNLFIYKKRECLFSDILLNYGVIDSHSNVLDIGANIGYFALLDSQLNDTAGFAQAIFAATTNGEYDFQAIVAVP